VRRSSCGVYAVALPLALLPLTTGLSAEDPETADRPRGDGNGVRVWRCRVQRAHGARRGTRARVPCPWTFMFIPHPIATCCVLALCWRLFPLYPNIVFLTVVLYHHTRIHIIKVVHRWYTHMHSLALNTEARSPHRRGHIPHLQGRSCPQGWYAVAGRCVTWWEITDRVQSRRDSKSHERHRPNGCADFAMGGRANGFPPSGASFRSLCRGCRGCWRRSWERSNGWRSVPCVASGSRLRALGMNAASCAAHSCSSGWKSFARIHTSAFSAVRRAE
jgi:hypothetical protein